MWSLTLVDTGLSLCQETAERKLEAKVRELQQLAEEVKMLKDSVQQETEEKNKLQAATDHLKAQLAEKEEQVGWAWSIGDIDFVCENNS